VEGGGATWPSRRRKDIFFPVLMITRRSGKIKAIGKTFLKNFRYANNTAVRPHKRSDANLKRLTSAASVTGDLKLHENGRSENVSIRHLYLLRKASSKMFLILLILNFSTRNHSASGSIRPGKKMGNDAFSFRCICYNFTEPLTASVSANPNEVRVQGGAT
jgi:hypothetical protein